MQKSISFSLNTSYCPFNATFLENSPKTTNLSFYLEISIASHCLYLRSRTSSLNHITSILYGIKCTINNFKAKLRLINNPLLHFIKWFDSKDARILSCLSLTVHYLSWKSTRVVHAKLMTCYRDWELLSEGEKNRINMQLCSISPKSMSIVELFSIFCVLRPDLTFSWCDRIFSAVPLYLLNCRFF